MTFEDTLADLGFTKEGEQVSRTLEQMAVDASMTKDGPYSVHGIWVKGDVRVTQERNVSPDSHDAGEEDAVALVTHPKLLVVDSPKGRACVRPSDTTSLVEVIKALG